MNTFAITIKVLQLGSDPAKVRSHVGGKLFTLWADNKIDNYRVKLVEKVVTGGRGLRHQFDVHATVDAESQEALYLALLPEFGLGGAAINFGVFTSIGPIEADLAEVA